MKEDVRENRGQYGGIDASAPLVVVPPAVQARRRRIVRILTLATLLGTIALSAMPEARRVKSKTTYQISSGITRTTYVYYDRALGMPFNTATASIGDGGEIRSFSVHPGGIVGNLAVMIGALGAVTFLLGRRRRKV